MGFRWATKLYWCIAAIGLVRCAGPLLKENASLQLRNQQLARQLSARESEVERLERFMAAEDLEPPPLVEPETPDLPVRLLKPKVAVDAAAEEERLLKNKTLADSEHEALAWYQQGQNLMQSGNYDGAVQAFAEFLHHAPDHVYADRAHFWIAESYFRNREYALALVADNRMMTLFPESMKAPQSMYRAALSQEKMGHTRAAEAILRELMRQYPRESEAVSASKKLVELSQTSRG